MKVLLIADNLSYQIFYQYDPDFRKVFKVKADFDASMERDDRAVAWYAWFIARLARDEHLPHFDRSAAAAVVEEGVRLAGRQGKLSTRFSDVADLVREASYWAKEDGASVVTGAYVNRAVRESIERRNLIESRMAEMTRDGILMIATDGARVGELNGLSVYDVGDYRFGRPTKITASVAAGRAGIISIEREADLSGKSHNKGVLILAGYFRARFAQKVPLASFRESRARAELQRSRGRQRLFDRALRASLGALAAAPAPGRGGDGLRQSEGRAPGHRRSQREDRGVLRRLPHGRRDRQAGSANPGSERLGPHAAEGRRGSGRGEALPNLLRLHGGTGYRAPHRGRGGLAQRTEGDYEGDTVYGLVQKRLAKMSKDAREALKSEREESKNGATGSGQAAP